MLNVHVPFPHVGSTAFIDDVDAEGRDVIERVRIIALKADGHALISLRSYRYPHEIARGNRTVPLISLRETEQPLPPAKPSGRTKGRRR